MTYRIEIKIINENERKISVEAISRSCPSFRQIFISLGTNIEPREQRLADARLALKAEEPLNWQESKIYETEPWGEPDQAKFLNQAVGFSSKKTPQQLLELCKRIEREQGRQKRGKWREREIDLDLLYCENDILEGENLTVPHPRIAQREFVLKPLCDIAPDFIDPGSKFSIKEMLAATQPNSQPHPAFYPVF
jgi:2-amino-4-hydroxy-6-hydroxymethyldihydropteridine diphosphokinase